MPLMVHIDSEVFSLWDKTPTKIAQLELLAIVSGLLTFPALFRGAYIIWWVDNVAALMALIQGRSGHVELDRMAQIAHIVLFHLECIAYFELVPSSANWSDGIPRDGLRDAWWRNHNFAVHVSTVPVLLWRLPFKLLFRVLAFF